MRTLIHVIINGLAIWVASVLLSGITLASSNTSTTSKITTVLVVGALFGIVNVLIRPIVKFFSFPFLLVTLGLFIFIINAAMLMLTSKLAGALNLDFHVDRFWPTAVWGALIVSIVSWSLNALFGDDVSGGSRTRDRGLDDYRQSPYGGHSRF